MQVGGPAGAARGQRLGVQASPASTQVTVEFLHELAQLFNSDPTPGLVFSTLRQVGTS
jgi:hypothetical protein